MEEASPLNRKKMPRKKQGIVSTECKYWCKYWEIVVARGGLWPEPSMSDPKEVERLVTGRLCVCQRYLRFIMNPLLMGSNPIFG